MLTMVLYNVNINIRILCKYYGRGAVLISMLQDMSGIEDCS
jgi:hypothetical protein